MKRLPWKGSDLARGPRVRIPLLPPMCDKCIKRAIGRVIVDAELKLDKAFAEVTKNPSLANDEAFISLANKMADLLDKYEKMK